MRLVEILRERERERERDIERCIYSVLLSRSEGK